MTGASAMTEAQLKAFVEFKTLPVYDEHDQRANSLTALAVSGPYRRIRECATLQEVENCLKDRQLVPLGGLRAETGSGQVVIAYFGVKP
jgi:hypothetical protein